ncbi:MAG TPA: helix-hairpin-helix domain-containing protein, partial [Gemmata sp.]|nr:helix-hairpin-helix domain-containing protein [Gemmata sp.]
EVEAEFFDLFCTVEKIGAKKALKAMARPVKEIIDAIARQDVRWLSTLPGIGAATAEQIVTTLKRKIANLAAKAQPPYESAGEADASSDVAGENGKRRKKGASDASRSPEPEPATALDGQLIDTVYQALLGLGHSPIEARSRLDYLLTLGKPFHNFDEAMTLIYGQRG